MSRNDAIRAVVGLVALFALTFLVGNRWARALERRIGVTMFAGSGLLFVALGAFARHPKVGILSDAVLTDLRPLLEIGLGWVGFRIGTEFDVRELERLPPGIGRLVFASTLTAFVACGFGTIGALSVLGGSMDRGELVRAGLLLGACAAVSAPSGARALEAAGLIDDAQSRLLRKVTVLGDAIAIGVVAMLYRPAPGGTWALPALGWLLLQLGLGVAVGLLMLAIVNGAATAVDGRVLTVGAIAFSSGIAGYFGLSALVIGGVTGVVVATGSAGRGAGTFGEHAKELERPIYFLFFAIAGAYWDVRDHRGWWLLPLYVVARVAAKQIGAHVALRGGRRHLPLANRPDELPIDALPGAPLVTLALIPSSAMSVAVLVDALAHYGYVQSSFVQTVVLAGAIVAEIGFHVRLRVRTRRATSTVGRGDGAERFA